jgi:hypothetical protein
MQTASYPKTSFFGLFRELKDEAKTFVREEVQLAKTELSENVASMGRNAVSIAIGGFVAYAGAILFLAGLAFALAFALEKLGLDRMLAAFIGFAVLGLIVAGVGYMFIAKALKGFSHSSVAPQRTIETLKEFKHPEQVMTAEEREKAEKAEEKKEEKQKKAETPKRSSDEVQASVVATEAAMGDTMHEIKRRMRPSYAKEVVKTKIIEHPYRWNFVAMGTGLAGALLVKYKMAHSNHHNGHFRRRH